MNRINFKPFPEIKTERFLLRQLNLNDAKTIFEIRSNEAIAKYLDRPKAKTINDALEFIKKINNGIKKNELIYWGITQKENSAIVGTVTLWQISDDCTEAEIGFELLPKFQGKGIIQEVLPEIIKFGFNLIGLSKIKGEVDCQNVKSIKLLKNLSFTKRMSMEKTNIYTLSSKTFAD